MTVICELNEYPEMENVFNIIINKTGDENVLSSGQDEAIFSTLNAIFLTEWITQNIKLKLSKINEFVNSYIERKEIKNEDEIEFLSKKVLKYDDNTTIYLPKFKPINFFYLFINYNDYMLQHFVNGPILKYNNK